MRGNQSAATGPSQILDLADLIRRRLPDLEDQLAEQGRWLPRRVPAALRAIARCGDPCFGFAWLRCGPCDQHRLVAHSCKTRVLCGRCGGRRMATFAAHLVDHVLPRVAVRQFVLTVPWPRRWLLARRPSVARGVLGVALRTLFRWQAARAEAVGVPGGEGGSVTWTQRFGSALNLNLHFHMLLLDGVFAPDPVTGHPRWHRIEPPTTSDVEGLVIEIAQRCEAWLARRGHSPDGSPDEDHIEGDSDPGDAQLVIQAAAVAGRSATARGRRARRVKVHRGREYRLPPRCATYNGYNLHAGVVAGTKDRKGLERLCRYIARPALAKERLSSLPGGRVRLALKSTWSDGTAAIEMTEVELLERLAALVPPARSHEVHYHGVLAPRHRWRRLVVPRGPPRESTPVLTKTGVPSPTSTWFPWAALLLRVFDVDALRCPECGNRMAVRAVVLPPATIRVIRGLERARGSPGRASAA